MSKFAQREETEEFKPTIRDAADLSDKLKKFEIKVIGGRKQYPFELFLESEGVIRFDEYGQMVMRSPALYKKWQSINGLREWKADKDLQEILETMPEEKKAHQLRITQLFAEIRAILRV